MFSILFLLNKPLTFHTEFSMDSTCDEVEGLIDKNFGETYTLAKKGIDDFTKGFKFKINYLGLTEIVSYLKNK